MHVWMDVCVCCLSWSSLLKFVSASKIHRHRQKNTWYCIQWQALQHTCTYYQNQVYFIHLLPLTIFKIRITVQPSFPLIFIEANDWERQSLSVTVSVPAGIHECVGWFVYEFDYWIVFLSHLSVNSCGCSVIPHFVRCAICIVHLENLNRTQNQTKTRNPRKKEKSMQTHCHIRETENRKCTTK